jgi:hypothetical protein
MVQLTGKLSVLQRKSLVQLTQCPQIWSTLLDLFNVWVRCQEVNPNFFLSKIDIYLLLSLAIL